MEEEGDVVATFPGFGCVIMDDEEITVIEAEVSFGGIGQRLSTGEERGADGLEIWADESASGDELRNTRKWVFGSKDRGCTAGERPQRECGGGSVYVLEGWSIRHLGSTGQQGWDGIVRAIYEEFLLPQRSKGCVWGKVKRAKSSKIQFVHSKYAFSRNPTAAHFPFFRNQGPDRSIFVCGQIGVWWLASVWLETRIRGM
jgi:hypothetical protein